MRRLTLMFFLLGCDDGDKGDVGEVDDTGTETAQDSGDTDDTHVEDVCEATVLSTEPADGAVEVEVDIQPTVVISEVDATTTLSSDIPGTFTALDDGLTYAWVPDGPLDYATTYTVSATTCTGTTSFSFSTVSVETPDHLVGRAWGMDLAGGIITEPAVLETLVGDSLVPGLLGVFGAGPGTVDLRVAAVEEGAVPPHQDYCLATSDVPGASYRDGLVHGSADEIWISLVPGDPVPIYNLEFEGQWTAEGEGFSGGAMEGELDARYICDWIGMDANGLCELADAFGFPCAECPDGTDYCVHMRIESLSGVEVSTTVSAVSANDCPECESGEPACE